MEDKDLYVIAVLRYKEENINIKKEDLFPQMWNSFNDYHLKIEIIAEAIQNHILIKDTKLYHDNIANGYCKILTNKNDKIKE